MQDEHIPIRTATLLTGMHPNTLRKYADQGKIQSYRTPAGQRMFHKQSLQTMFTAPVGRLEVSPVGKQSFLYARVSSKKQLDDLSRQIRFLQSRSPLYAGFVVLQDVASGINFRRPGLQTLLDACLQRTVGEVVVAHRDRLARFGFDLLQYLIEHAGGKLTVIDDQRNKSTEQELSEDLLSIIHVYCCKQMGKRSDQDRIQSRQDPSENERRTTPSDTTVDPHQ
jgi:predicted site-specific integrase-resolvase